MSRKSARPYVYRDGRTAHPQREVRSGRPAYPPREPAPIRRAAAALREMASWIVCRHHGVVATQGYHNTACFECAEPETHLISEEDEPP